MYSGEEATIWNLIEATRKILPDGLRMNLQTGKLTMENLPEDVHITPEMLKFLNQELQGACGKQNQVLHDDMKKTSEEHAVYRADTEKQNQVQHDDMKKTSEEHAVYRADTETQIIELVEENKTCHSQLSLVQEEMTKLQTDLKVPVNDLYVEAKGRDELLQKTLTSSLTGQILSKVLQRMSVCYEEQLLPRLKKLFDENVNSTRKGINEQQADDKLTKTERLKKNATKVMSIISEVYEQIYQSLLVWKPCDVDPTVPWPITKTMLNELVHPFQLISDEKSVSDMLILLIETWSEAQTRADDITSAVVAVHGPIEEWNVADSKAADETMSELVTGEGDFAGLTHLQQKVTIAALPSTLYEKSVQSRPQLTFDVAHPDILIPPHMSVIAQLETLKYVRDRMTNDTYDNLCARMIETTKDEANLIQEYPQREKLSIYNDLKNVVGNIGKVVNTMLFNKLKKSNESMFDFNTQVHSSLNKFITDAEDNKWWMQDKIKGFATLGTNYSFLESTTTAETGVGKLADSEVTLYNELLKSSHSLWCVETSVLNDGAHTGSTDVKGKGGGKGKKGKRPPDRGAKGSGKGKVGAGKGAGKGEPGKGEPGKGGRRKIAYDEGIFPGGAGKGEAGKGGAGEGGAPDRGEGGAPDRGEGRQLDKWERMGKALFIDQPAAKTEEKPETAATAQPWLKWLPGNELPVNELSKEEYEMLPSSEIQLINIKYGPRLELKQNLCVATANMELDSLLQIPMEITKEGFELENSEGKFEKLKEGFEWMVWLREVIPLFNMLTPALTTFTDKLKEYKNETDLGSLAALFKQHKGLNEVALKYFGDEVKVLAAEKSVSRENLYDSAFITWINRKNLSIGGRIKIVLFLNEIAPKKTKRDVTAQKTKMDATVLLILEKLMLPMSGQYSIDPVSGQYSIDPVFEQKLIHIEESITNAQTVGKILNSGKWQNIDINLKFVETLHSSLHNLDKYILKRANDAKEACNTILKWVTVTPEADDSYLGALLTAFATMYHFELRDNYGKLPTRSKHKQKWAQEYIDNTRSGRGLNELKTEELNKESLSENDYQMVVQVMARENPNQLFKMYADKATALTKHWVAADPSKNLPAGWESGWQQNIYFSLLMYTQLVSTEIKHGKSYELDVGDEKVEFYTLKFLRANKDIGKSNLAMDIVQKYAEKLKTVGTISGELMDQLDSVFSLVFSSEIETFSSKIEFVTKFIPKPNNYIKSRPALAFLAVAKLITHFRAAVGTHILKDNATDRIGPPPVEKLACPYPTLVNCKWKDPDGTETTKCVLPETYFKDGADEPLDMPECLQSEAEYTLALARLPYARTSQTREGNLKIRNTEIIQELSLEEIINQLNSEARAGDTGLTSREVVLKELTSNISPKFRPQDCTDDQRNKRGQLCTELN